MQLKLNLFLKTLDICFYCKEHTLSIGLIHKCKNWWFTSPTWPDLLFFMPNKPRKIIKTEIGPFSVPRACSVQLWPRPRIQMSVSWVGADLHEERHFACVCCERGRWPLLVAGIQRQWKRSPWLINGWNHTIQEVHRTVRILFCVVNFFIELYIRSRFKMP